MSNYNINPAAVNEVIDEFTAAGTQLQNSLANLEASVERFKAANKGLAPESYAQAQALWNQGQAEMTASLRQGHQILGEILGNYVYGDNKGAGIFA